MHLGGNHKIYLNDFINIFQNRGHKMMIVRIVLYPIVYYYCLPESLGHCRKGKNIRNSN